MRPGTLCMSTEAWTGTGTPGCMDMDDMADMACGASTALDAALLL